MPAAPIPAAIRSGGDVIASPRRNTLKNRDNGAEWDSVMAANQKMHIRVDDASCRAFQSR
jgi:hypothetical protein